jgi:magnesium transporter
VEVLTRVDAGQLTALRERDEFFWLDLRDPRDEDLTSLEQLLGLHPLALEDTREWGQRPKLDDYDDHLLLVFYTAQRDEGPGPEIVVPVETHVYVSGGFVLTFARGVCGELDTLHDVLMPEAAEEEDFLVYRILDGLAEPFDGLVEHIESRVDALEQQVLTNPRPEQLTTIYRLRQDVQALHRVVAPQRDAVDQATDALAHLPGLTHGSKPYLRDVLDHLERTDSEFLRQLSDLGGLADTFFNANANRVNTNAARLTVAATFFLVWTLVTSFFGQNFGWLVNKQMDDKWEFLLYGVGGLVFPTVALAIFFWSRRDQWL